MLEKIKDTSDVGDATQRNYRYQYAYGVILLVGAYIKKFDYVSIWCEHHEDILCKKLDGKYHAFQIKTRKKERGEWTLNDTAIQKSLNKFCLLEESYSNQVDAYYFVSNTSYLDVSYDVQNQKTLAKCPKKFIKEVRDSEDYSNINDPFKAKFDEICDELEIETELLFETLKKVKFEQGPSREDFNSVLSHDHISKIPSCKHFDSTKLDDVRDLLVGKFYLSSSLTKENGNTYWHFIEKDNLDDPELIAKKIELDIIDEIIANINDPKFKFALGLASLDLQKDRAQKTLIVKMKKGQLDHYIDTMIRRSVSAEQHLIELNYKEPDQFDNKLNQIISVVQSTCDDGHAIANNDGNINGLKMYQYVLESLNKLSEESPQKVENQDQDLLLGVAGILTDECKVWWSKKFDIDIEGEQ